MPKKTIYVSGHKNPDTDAIISAMAYAYLKQQLGYDAIAVRAGDLNPETQYILNMFNEFAPPLASDMKTRIRDIDIDEVVTCHKDENFKKALELMKKARTKVIAVIDDDRHLIGVASLSDITKSATDARHRAELMKKTPLKNIAEIINATVIYDSGRLDTNGEVYVASYHYLDCQDRIVVTSDNPQREQEAIEAGAKMMIVCGSDVSEEVIELAKKHGCTVLATGMSIYEVTREIDFAVPISMVMTTEMITFKFDDYVDDVKSKINKSRFRSYPVMDTRDHVIGMISRFHVLKHASRNLILVDHNELSQSLDGAEEANIIEIVDHHRIGGIRTASPVFFRNEQTGSCATIITEIFEEKGIEIPEELAGMLCCAIISDTVNFRSVTCTPKDIEQANKMARIANLDIQKVAPEILKAGASLSNATVQSLFHRDLKIFDVDRLKVAIAQNSITSLDSAMVIKEGMNLFLEEYARTHGLDLCVIVFSMIDGSGSYMLCHGPESSLAYAAFEDVGVMQEGFMFLPKIMSRKLQIIPRITQAVEDRK